MICKTIEAMPSAPEYASSFMVLKIIVGKKPPLVKYSKTHADDVKSAVFGLYTSNSRNIARDKTSTQLLEINLAVAFVASAILLPYNVQYTQGVRHGFKIGGAKASKLLKMYCKF